MIFMTILMQVSETDQTNWLRYQKNFIACGYSEDFIPFTYYIQHYMSLLSLDICDLYITNPIRIDILLN